MPGLVIDISAGSPRLVNEIKTGGSNFVTENMPGVSSIGPLLTFKEELRFPEKLRTLTKFQ